MYLYLISAGEYSSYGVDSFAVSENRLTKEQLNIWETEFKQLPYPGRRIGQFLIQKGLKIVYPAGEFWGNYDDVDFSDEVREGEENSFRIGLA